MQVDLLGSAQSAHALHLFHQHSPLVHCMTNDVVQTFTANTLLALIAGLDVATQQVSLPTELVVRASTAACKRVAKTPKK